MILVILTFKLQLILGEEGSSVQMDIFRNECPDSLIRVQVFRCKFAQDVAKEIRSHGSESQRVQSACQKILDTTLCQVDVGGRSLPCFISFVHYGSFLYPCHHRPFSPFARFPFSISAFRSLIRSRLIFSGNLTSVCLRFKKENQNSSITFEHFKQIYAYRQGEKRKQPDTSNIPIDDSSLFKTEKQIEKMQTMEQRLAERRSHNLKMTSKENLCRCLSKIYVQVGEHQQLELKQRFRQLMELKDGNYRTDEFANFVLELVNNLPAKDSPANIELELEFRAIFADLLSVSLDVFDEEHSLPRRLLPHLMRWKRGQNIKIANEKGLGEIPEVEDDQVQDQEESSAPHPMLERLRNELPTSQVHRFFDSISACS
eukprot:766462-Hanusia_phi.AAC.4